MGEELLFNLSCLGEDHLKWKENSQNSCNWDLTSIINELENGNLENLTEQSVFMKSLDKDLSFIENWVDKSLKTSLSRPDNTFIPFKFLHRINKLSKNLKSVYYANIKHCGNKQSGYTYICRKCKVDIPKKAKDKKTDILTKLERHSHLEEFFNGRKYVLNEVYVKNNFDFDTDNVIKVVEDVIDTRLDEFQQSSASTSNSNSVSFRDSDSSTEVRNCENNSYLPNYIEENYVNHIFYPPELMKHVFKIQGMDLVTVQRFKNNGYACLLCDKTYDLEKQVFKHVKSSKHLDSMFDPSSVVLLKNYYQTFSSIKNNIGYHQGVFRLGSNLKSFMCKICRVVTQPANILEHLLGGKHNRYVGSNQQFYQYFFYNEMLQVISSNYGNTLPDKLKPLVLKEENMSETSNHVEENKEKANNNKETVEEIKEHNLIVSMVDNPQNIFESLETRLRVHEKFFEFKGEKLCCLACRVEFIANRNLLSYHISSIGHLKLAKGDLDKRKWIYYCDLCLLSERSETRWYFHINSAAHKQRLAALPTANPKARNYKEYECEACLVVFYGNLYAVEKHLKQPVNRSRKKKKEYRLTPFVEKIFASERLLEERILKLTTSADQVLELHDLNLQCCEAIREAIKSEYPKCKAFPFGSRVTGIGTMESDLDIFVDTGNMYDGLMNQDAESQAHFVRQVTKVLRKHPDFVEINPIAQARTPIIQVYHKVTKIDCDLSFRHGLSVENTEYLRLCLDVQPILKPLVLVLKFWMHQAYFERVTTYALSMLIIFYMQVNNYLPSVTMIRELDATPSRTIAGWKTFRYTKPLDDLIALLSPCNLTTRQLMIGFFKYYLDFNYEEQVICPLLGRPILKSAFDEEKGLNLPDEMQNYVQKVENDEHSERFRHLSPICIQDPFDLSHNLTKACPKDYVQKFTALCSLSYKLLIGSQ